MGNTLRGRRATKVMKINGETMKFKKPTSAGEILKDFPGHVLLDSEAVKHFGIRAKPLEAEQELKSRRLYFLVELPKPPPPPPFSEDRRAPRKVRSGIQMSAKDRLDSLMLARRSVSDFSAMKSSSPSSRQSVGIIDGSGGGEAVSGVTRLKLRLPKAEVERLMMESRDENEAAEKIVELCNGNSKGDSRSDHQGLFPHSSSQNDAV